MKTVVSGTISGNTEESAGKRTGDNIYQPLKKHSSLVNDFTLKVYSYSTKFLH